ncbi:hypothetical protein MAC_07903 [Metarhizium acridum CQMa 102]|uniref:Ankyrin 2,3/unc44 n=1 Tax=Metarhizium acridum (strain CQMa 102) TaxID=655827 RepID=E9EDF5_METAQ|nr:uncharacterized protein MAC_07903 [Metarhizium acridum CQMa 102]EFY86019.1 hypothetical protein MAC_07903 [Metarhizium acridum CQMa 102]
MAAPKLFALEIAEYGDEELDRYLEENGRDRVHSADDRSRSVDLDEVSARLLQASAQRQSSPKKHTPIEQRARRYGVSIEAFELLFAHQSSSQDPSTPTSSEEPEDPYLQDLRYEREDYDELVKDGGRPWYPIHRLEEISRNPKGHRELLRYWQGAIGGNPDEWIVFGAQVLRWRNFREWQVNVRKHSKGPIAEHTEWARRFLLKRHSYTAPPEFAFEEDPKRQDQLTTWIEYLAYESNFSAKRFEWHRRRARWYDDQWKKLVDSGVLRPHETEEFICSPDPAFQRTSERIQAEKAVESARQAIPLAEQAVSKSSCPSPLVRQRLEAAQSKLDSAVQSLESIRRRNQSISEFLGNTRSYRHAKHNAERHAILLQWVKEQVSLIEVELEQDKVAESNSETRSGESQGTKRVRADEDTEGRGNKRQKHHDEERKVPRTRGQTLKRTEDDVSVGHGAPSKRPKPDSPAVVRQLRRSLRQTVHRSESKVNAPGSSTNIVEPSAVTGPLRRSARIANRQSRSGITTAPPRSARGSHQGPCRTAGPPIKASRAVKGKGRNK